MINSLIKTTLMCVCPCLAPKSQCQLPACMNVKITILYSCFYFATQTLVAQFNDTTNYYVNYTSTGIINNTNEGNSYVLNNNVRFNVYKKHILLNTTNGWVFGEQWDVRTNNDFTSVADINLFKEERHVYYWGLANYEKSYSLKVNYRV